MKTTRIGLGLLTLMFVCTASSWAQPPQQVAGRPPGEANANSVSMPESILRSGIRLNAPGLSANSVQLADQIGLREPLERVQQLRASVSASGEPTLASLTARQDLVDATERARAILQEANLAVDFTVSEITAELQLYDEVLSTYQGTANRNVQYANWASYYTNGALWATGEGLDIPTWKRPKYSISSGTTSILAGVVPSFFSLWAMKLASGGKHAAKKDPNMLAKLFDLAPDAEVDYPKQVWTFLQTIPAETPSAHSRKDQLIDRWVADKNIPKFTDRHDKAQLELLAATVDTRKGITIDLLQTRKVMLGQLANEVVKMKRLLFELSMALNGEKRVAL